MEIIITGAKFEGPSYGPQRRPECAYETSSIFKWIRKNNHAQTYNSFVLLLGKLIKEEYW